MTDREMFIIAKNEYNIIQQESEILWALQEIQKHIDGENSPRIIVELGCSGGGSLCMWSRLLRDGDLLIGISPNPNIEGRTKRIELTTGIGVILIDGKSEDHDTIDRLEGILDGRKVDFLFIDTIHTYKQSNWEHCIYSPLVGSPGVIGYHDIVAGRTMYGEPCTGDYWHEVKYKYDYVEKHDKIGGENFGIGLLLL